MLNKFGYAGTIGTSCNIPVKKKDKFLIFKEQICFIDYFSISLVTICNLASLIKTFKQALQEASVKS